MHSGMQGDLMYRRKMWKSEVLKVDPRCRGAIKEKSQLSGKLSQVGEGTKKQLWLLLVRVSLASTTNQ